MRGLRFLFSLVLLLGVPPAGAEPDRGLVEYLQRRWADATPAQAAVVSDRLIEGSARIPPDETAAELGRRAGRILARELAAKNSAPFVGGWREYFEVEMAAGRASWRQSVPRSTRVATSRAVGVTCGLGFVLVELGAAAGNLNHLAHAGAPSIAFTSAVALGAVGAGVFSGLYTLHTRRADPERVWLLPGVETLARFRSWRRFWREFARAAAVEVADRPEWRAIHGDRSERHVRLDLCALIDQTWIPAAVRRACEDTLAPPLIED